MAYVDKCSDMRRMVVSKGGHVIWEGVKIDDTCLLTCRERSSIWDIEFRKLKKYYEEENENIIYLRKKYGDEEPYIIMFKDSEEQEHWNVKEDYIKELVVFDAKKSEQENKK